LTGAADVAASDPVSPLSGAEFDPQAVASAATEITIRAPHRTPLGTSLFAPPLRLGGNRSGSQPAVTFPQRWQHTTKQPRWHAAGMAADGLTLALEDYRRAQDELVAARNRLARAIAGAAMSGMTRDEIVEATGYPAERVLRICIGAGVSGTAR
jgi:hypothetical protein